MSRAPASPQVSPTLRSTPTPEPSPTPLACWRQGGRKESGSLDTPLLRQPLEFLVYLPPCYDEQPERRYSVLYLVHGQSYNQDQWDRLGADETVDRLSASGELPPFLIVMPRDRVWTQPTEDPFGQAVVEVLIPHVDRQYRTLAERAYRAVGGLSRGGGWAVHLGITHPELFGALGGHSPAIFHTDTQHLRTWLAETPVEALPRIYLDIGEKDRPDILRSALWFENLLTELRIPHRWHLFTGYHEEAYWSAHLEGYLRWYAQEWSRANLESSK
jgi:enterochelin esterase-like enzyme